MASDIPATSEVILQTDASKQILDAFLGHGWDLWGASLGGAQASELLLQMFSSFNSAMANGSLESLTLQYYLNERGGLSVSPGGEWDYSGNWFQFGGDYKFEFNGNLAAILILFVIVTIPQ